MSKDNEARVFCNMDISVQLNTMYELEKSVRDHINTHRYQIDLLNDSRTWNQICSSLDVIGDSCIAIESYCSNAYPEDIGLKYVYTYGILQALFIQQDALRNLTEAFQFDYEMPITLKKIRGLRNASIGHPTKQGGAKSRIYNYISRYTLSKNGFELLRSTGEGNFFTESVHISEIIEEQLDEIISGYSAIAEQLTEIDEMHKDTYRGNPLLDFFHSGIGYQFEKIGLGVLAHSSSDREYGLTNLHILKETYDEFRTALEERGELSSYTDHDLQEYFHAITRLEAYLSNTEDFMEEADARIYHSYIRSQHDRFVKIAEEIDEEYLSAGSRS